VCKRSNYNLTCSSNLQLTNNEQNQQHFSLLCNHSTVSPKSLNFLRSASLACSETWGFFNAALSPRILQVALRQSLLERDSMILTQLDDLHISLILLLSHL
jgi:hypothetical protein